MEYPVHDRHMNRSSYLQGNPFLERSIKHYSNFHQILLVGEGDFSFSLSLANAFGSAENMVATSLDSREKLLRFYKSTHETLSNLERLGALILHGVDVTTMEEHHIIRKMKFHRIVYNFPHAGFCGQECDSSVINKHRHLLKMFFKNAQTMVSEIGEIHVSHKVGDPYNKWELVKQAEECGLHLKKSVNFSKEDYPGYVNKRGALPRADEVFHLGECRTYMFVLGPAILYKREIMAIQAVLPNISFEACAEIAGELGKANAETSANHLKMLVHKEFARPRIDTLHQIAQAWRVKATISEQLDAALELKEDAFKRKETILKEAILEVQSERQARKNAETDKAHLEACLNDLKLVLVDELNENDELKRQRDAALRQREEAGRLKRNTAIQMLSFVSSSVAFSLFLFHKCKNKSKGASKNEQDCKNGLSLVRLLFHSENYRNLVRFKKIGQGFL